MNSITIRNVTIGDGIPKICVPVTGSTDAEVLENTAFALHSRCDLIEWRADHYDKVYDTQATLQLLSQIRKMAQDIPVIFTFRTAAEGGRRKFPIDNYANLNRSVMESKLADVCDLELYTCGGFLDVMTAYARNFGVYTIVSNHDFHKTPSAKELIKRFETMETRGCDMAKIAVMPQTKKDVLTLLEASIAAHEKLSCPIVSMSMGNLGSVTRICGEFSGSCMTFGTAKTASAPGQINANKLAELLGLFHDNFAQ